MRIADYKRFDMLNGPGIRHSLFVSGCSHRCPGCFNAAAWSFDYGEPWTAAYAERVLADLRPRPGREDEGGGRRTGRENCRGSDGLRPNPEGNGEDEPDRRSSPDGDSAAAAAPRSGLRIAGLSLLGGEPFENTDALVPLARAVRAECPDQTIWAWSGYTYEQLLAETPRRELLTLCDVLVDGPYEAARRNLKLRWRGSDNQRIIDVGASLACGAPVTLPD